MNIALLARVSTQEQAINGHSINEQIDRMHKYALYMKRINDQYHFIEKLNGYNRSLEAQAN